MTGALTEVEAAAAGGFKLWRHFCRARKAKLFPAPALELPGVGPVWTQQQIDDWLGIRERAEVPRPSMQDEAIRRVEEAALRRQPKIWPR